MCKFKREIFRFITLITIAVILSCCSLVTVFSATKVGFTLNDCSTDNNRLFTITMTADCDKKLSAANFEFTYDKSMFEFRSARISDESSKIAYNELDDKVKLVFLNTDGVDINNGTSIFTLTFKSVKSGVAYIDFYVSDCIDSDINSIDAGKCTSAKITVNSKSSDSSTSKSSINKSDKSDSSGTKSERGKAEETTYVSTYDEVGQLNSFDNPNTRLLIVGIALGASLIASVMLAYNIIKRIKSNVNKRKNSPDE